ncbi:uncharacterized protein LOC141818593, partial [Curcuma longa]|uniref:uncharacterized protein LOC141818593 n=1 Tax=Curcuma longa TaxID=136217 RepID=UPI003D9EE482
SDRTTLALSFTLCPSSFSTPALSSASPRSSLSSLITVSTHRVPPDRPLTPTVAGHRHRHSHSRSPSSSRTPIALFLAHSDSLFFPSFSSDDGLQHAPLNSPDGRHGRLDSEDNSSLLLNGERNGLASHDQDGSLLGPATSPVVSGRRDVSRPLSGAKSFEDDVDLEDGKIEKERNKPLRYDRRLKLNRAFLSGLAYCLSSCSMILVNKVVLSGHDYFISLKSSPRMTTFQKATNLQPG